MTKDWIEWWMDYNRLRVADNFAEHLRNYKQLTEKENKMETKEQLEAKVKELQAIIDKMPNETNGFWKPKTNEVFYSPGILDSKVYANVYKDMDSDKFIVSLGLYSKTLEGIKNKFEALQVHQQLKEIAHELNGGREINWENTDDKKFYLTYDIANKEIFLGTRFLYQSNQLVHCLSYRLKEVALERIGRDKLIRYLKGE